MGRTIRASQPRGRAPVRMPIGTPSAVARRSAIDARIARVDRGVARRARGRVGRSARLTQIEVGDPAQPDQHLLDGSGDRVRGARAPRRSARRCTPYSFDPDRRVARREPRQDHGRRRHHDHEQQRREPSGEGAKLDMLERAMRQAPRRSRAPAAAAPTARCRAVARSRRPSRAARRSTGWAGARRASRCASAKSRRRSASSSVRDCWRISVVDLALPTAWPASADRDSRDETIAAAHPEFRAAAGIERVERRARSRSRRNRPRPLRHHERRDIASATTSTVEADLAELLPESRRPSAREWCCPSASAR